MSKSFAERRDEAALLWKKNLKTYSSSYLDAHKSGYTEGYRAAVADMGAVAEAIDMNIPLAHKGNCNVNMHKELRELGCCCGKDTLTKALELFARLKKESEAER